MFAGVQFLTLSLLHVAVTDESSTVTSPSGALVIQGLM
jgi:hypothetical protein